MPRLVILLLLLCPVPAWAQVAHDGEADLNVRVNTSPVSITGKTTAGSDRVGVVCVGLYNNTADVTGITWGGVAMTERADHVSTAQFGLRVWLWTIVAPATASSDIEITSTGAINGYAAASSYTGVDQTTPVSATATAAISATGAASPATVNIASAADEMVVDCTSMFDDDGPTVGAGQTQIYNGGTFSSEIGVASSREAGAGTVTMSWTYGAYANQDWVLAAASLNAAGGGSAPPRLLLLGVGQ